MNNPLCILLIDDNPDDRTLVIRELRQEVPKLQVKQITEPKSFARALEAGDFDLVITDYQLRWTDGLEVLRAVKARYPDRPVIMFTATGSEEIAVEAMKTGLDDYVLKSPKHFVRLSAVVRSALERARQRQAMKEAGTRYRSLFERVPVGLYRTTPAGQIVDANPAMVDMLGYPDRESLLAVNTADLYVDPEERTRWQALMDREGVARDFETRLRRRDGTILWVDNDARATRDAEGRVLYYEGSLEDITERKWAEQALRRRAALNRVQAEVFKMRRTEDIDNVLTAIYRELRTVGVPFNDCSINLLKEGTEPPEFVCYCISSERVWVLAARVDAGEEIGKMWRTGKPVYRRDLDREDVYGERRYIDGVWEKRIRSVVDVPFSRGTLAINSVGADAFSDEDIETLKQFAGVLSEAYTRFEDIRKIEESEENYRSIVEHSQDVIFRMDLEGNYLLMSPVVEQVMGYTPEEFYADRTLGRRIVLPEDLEKVEEEFRKVCSGETSRDVEYRVKTRDGGVLWVSQTTFPIKDSEGRIAAIEGTIRDITEHKRAEEEKEKIQAQLLQAQKMEAIGTLAGGMAHDFNNLLTIIQGYAELAMMKLNADDLVFRHLKEVQRASVRAANLTRQLLLFSRRQPMEMIPLDLNKTIEDMMRMVRRLIGEDISIITDLDEGLRMVNADPGNIEQVVMNLMVNAKDAMPEGGEITIRTENVHLDEDDSKAILDARPGTFVRVSLADTGIGMDRETVGRIFEPFFSTKGPGRGTGLGLSVVYGIIKQHEGWINVYSELGQGATFRIYLPAVPLQPDTVDERRISLAEFQGRGERILLVEDAPAVRELTTRTLRENGYVVFEAANAEEALDLFEREKGEFHLVFSDVVLPDQTGLQLVDQLLSRNPDLRILLSSGYPGQKSQWSVIRERGFRFLQKPYRLPDLLRAIREVLETEYQKSNLQK